MPVLDRRRREDPRRDATERAFLDATEELMGEGASFADLSVSRIAARAGRQRTAFYAHFEDRRALLLRLAQQLVEDARVAVEPFVAGADVRDAIDGLLAMLREHDIAVRAVAEAAGYDEHVARFWGEVVDGFVAATRPRLEQAGCPDPHATAVALVWMTERSLTQQIVGNGPAVSDDALLEALSETWRRALRP